jgi:hypothetical protein
MGIQQSTGQTLQHIVVRHLKTFTFHFPGTSHYVRNRRLRFIRLSRFHPLKQLFPVSWFRLCISIISSFLNCCIWALWFSITFVKLLLVYHFVLFSLRNKNLNLVTFDFKTLTFDLLKLIFVQNYNQNN